MSNGEVWRAQNDISQNPLYVPVFTAYFEYQMFSGVQYLQKLEINNKTYYMNFISPNQGTYIRDNSSKGTFKYVRGILSIKDSSDVEIEKFKNNHNNEIDAYTIVLN